MGISKLISTLHRKFTVPQMKRPLAGMILAVFVLALILNVLTGIPSAASENGKPKLIMVIVDRVTVEDITNEKHENIKRLIALGGLGLTTINSGGDFTDINSYVSLGGGDKFIGSVPTGESFNREEILNDGSRALEAYQRNTGQNPGLSKVLNISIATILNVNQKRYTVSTPGRLGAVLHQAGLKTAVIGNSDLAPKDEPNRLAAVIAMDDWGRVDEGNVGLGMLTNDPISPYGWRTDYGKLKTELDRLSDLADFVVVETGDTVRANQSSSRQMKKMVDFHRDRALKEVDGFIGSLLPLVSKDTMIMLVTPLPHAQALRDGVRLAPVIIAGGSVVPGSVLTSPSTRQKGLVANYDITATVVDHLGAKPAEGIVGLPAHGIKVPGQTQYIKDMSKWLTANSLQRIGVLYYFTRYQWVVYALVLLQIVFRYFRRIELARFLLAAILLYPLAILLLPLTGSVNPSLTITLSLAIVALLTYIVTRIRDDLKLYLAAAGANVLSSVVDVLTGGSLMKKAALSYDLVVGGRFYGIGNEYMGVVIGSAILGTAALLQLYPEKRKGLLPVIGLLFAGLIVFFAAPSVGSKAGGALTAMVGFSAALYLFLGGKVKLRTGLLLLSALVAGVAVLAAVNYFLPAGQQSHIGRAFNNLFAGNYLAIWQMILRKVAANFYLLKHSPFATILLLQLLIWVGLFSRNRRNLNAMYCQMPYLKAGFTGMLFGALAAIILNDSGVIGAPLLLNYLIVPLVFQSLRLAAANKGANEQANRG